MSAPDPALFADEWIDAWNRHDLDAILSHYADDIVFLSPAAARIAGTGRVVGKPALRDYWTKALARIPDLAFELETVYAGADAVTISYVGVGGRKVAEAFEFGEDGRVVRAIACYGV